MIIDKYSRNKFFARNNVNGLSEPDLLKNKFRDFEFKRQHTFYTVKHGDQQRPDVICFKLYRKVNYWWILMKANGIEDIWNDLTVGKVLMVPSEADIEEFIVKSKKSK